MTQARELQTQRDEVTLDDVLAAGGIWDAAGCHFRFADGSLARFVQLETATGASIIRRTGPDRDEYEPVYRLVAVPDDDGE